MPDRRAVPGAIVEPLGQSPLGRQRFDFASRARDNIQDAQRYTRFVIIMKRALVIAAVILLGIVIAYAMMPRQQDRMAMTFEKMGLVAGDLTMVKPKLNGIDGDGNPFVVTADTAVQDPKNMHRATLRNMEADLAMKDGQWMTVTAPHGKMDSQLKTVLLSGAVAVFTDQGFEMHTDLASVDLNKGVMIGPHHVTGQGPQGTFVADSFYVERLHDPCVRGKKASAKPQAAKPKVRKPGSPAAVICPVRPPGVPVQKNRPLIHLNGNVHMLILPNAMQAKPGTAPKTKKTDTKKTKKP
jgi:lipopolysaccharide export system protein LptC